MNNNYNNSDNNINKSLKFLRKKPGICFAV